MATLRKVHKLDYISTRLVSGNASKKKSLLINYHIHCRRISILFFLTSTILVSSSFYLLPLAYSQELSYFSNWRETGRGQERLSEPAGIAADPSSGNIYVADTSNNRIQVFSNNGTFISKWGKYGTADGSFNSPTGIASDQQGNIYVADTSNDRIQVFSNNGTFISKWGTYGSTDGSFNNPAGIAVDSEGNTYVADTANHRIQVFSNNGTFISKWGTYGSTDVKMRYPEGIAIDQEANVYLADTANNRIIAFSRSRLTDLSYSSEDGEVYGNNTRIKIETVYDGLKTPTAISFLGPDDMLVLQSINNSIMRIVNGQMLDEPVLDLENTVRIRGCMCDIAILRNDNGTTYAYLYYFQGEVAEENGTKKIVNQLYRYDVAADGKFTNPKLIFEIPSFLGAPHNGGKVMVGPDNNVYVTIGEIRRYQTQAQNVKNGSLPDGSGSILRFTPDGDSVDGGLLGDTHPLDKYYAYGIRNSFGLDYDPITGNIWMTDNGPAYGDELNLVIPGFNGGWNKVIGSSLSPRPFNLTELEFFNGTGKYYNPIFEWFETIGVTDLAFVSSDNNKLGEEYEGNLFVGDIKSGYLYRFLLNQSRTGLLLNGSLSDGVANNNLEAQESVLAKIKGGITDLEIGPDGLLYIVSIGGKIMRLKPIDANVTLPLIEANITDTAPVGINRTATNTTETGNITGRTRATTIAADATTGVSIVPDSSTLTDTAYQPNPVQVSVGDTVRWTNDDSQPHTVTSGQNATPDGMFDSSIMAPGATFDFTFTEPGEYPYFCLLHPNMVGTVSVS
jgi:glucose/arabinose dehydrogenase/plastocyanin